MFRGLFRSCAKDQRGAVGPAYAVGILALVAVSGVGFDYGRMASLDSELQNGADQAALAGATQLDGEAGACARAADAVTGYVQNHTRVATDGAAPLVTFVAATDCAGATDGASGSFIKFWQDREKTTAADDDANAKFIEVSVDARRVDYALTPLVGAISSELMHAAAMAGIGSSICKVPPLMICSPVPSVPFDAAGKKGWGVKATGHGGGNSAWAPGAFGFLEVGNTQKADLERALAFKDLPIDCIPIDGTEPETGNAQGLFRAINTRFDIYDDSGQPLNQCQPGGKCPAASNVVKDMIKANTNVSGNNSCKTHNSGWKLPPADRRFSPRQGNQSTDTNSLVYDADSVIDAMGLTRDLCHYDTYFNGNSANRCNTLTGLGASVDPDNRFGPGRWARRDYFNKYHSTGTWPPAVDSEYLMNSGDATSFTRYGLYKWEQAQANIPQGFAGGVNGKQYGQPICSTGTADGLDRRVLTIAIVKNCSQLSGGSTPVVVDEWIDAFFVEPTVDARGNGAGTDSIYLEVIGPANLGGGGGAAQPQTIRRDVPYLVQ